MKIERKKYVTNKAMREIQRMREKRYIEKYTKQSIISLTNFSISSTQYANAF